MSDLKGAKPAENKAPAPTPAPEAKPEPKPEQKGTDFLDFSKYPEDIRGEIEPRFRRLYGHVKANERATANALNGFGELKKYTRALEEKLNALQQDNADTKRTDVVADLKSRIKRAGEDGDFNLLADLTEKLAEVKAEVPKKKESEPEIVQEVDTGLTSADRVTVERWAGQVGRNGSLLRPWTQEGHPLRDKAVSLLNANLADPDFAQSPIEEILAEVDRAMIRPRRGNQPQVLDGSTERPKTETINLSAVQKYAAERLYPDMGPKEAHARYGKSLKGLKETT